MSISPCDYCIFLSSFLPLCFADCQRCETVLWPSSVWSKVDWWEQIQGSTSSSEKLSWNSKLYYIHSRDSNRFVANFVVLSCKEGPEMPKVYVQLCLLCNKSTLNLRGAFLSANHARAVSPRQITIRETRWNQHSKVHPCYIFHMELLVEFAFFLTRHPHNAIFQSLLTGVFNVGLPHSWGLQNSKNFFRRMITQSRDRRLQSTFCSHRDL